MKKMAMFRLMLNTFTMLLGVGIIIPVLPAYLDYFHASGMTAGLLVAAFGVTQFLFSPLGGKWSDRYGRKGMLLCGLILNCLSHLLFAVADHLSLLFISRLLGGMGLGLTIPSIMAYVVDVTDRDNRGKGMGWIGASVSLGVAVGPGIGGFLAEISIRTPYYAAAMLGLISAISTLWLPETRKTEALERMSKEQAEPKANLLQRFVRSVRSEYFMLLVLSFIMNFGIMNYETAFPLLTDDLYAYTMKEIAAIVTAGAIMGVIVQSFLLTRLIKSFGEVGLLNGSLLFAAITLSLLLVWGNLLYVLIISMLFFTFQSLLRPAISTLLSKRASDQEQGYVHGLSNTYMSLGNILGPIAAGMLYDIQHTFPYLFGSLVLLAGMGLFMSQERIGTRTRKHVGKFERM